MYLTATRPNLIFALGLLSRFMEWPWKLVQRLSSVSLDMSKEPLILASDIEREKELRSLLRQIVIMEKMPIIEKAHQVMCLCWLVELYPGLPRSSQWWVSLSTTKVVFIVAAHCACQGVWSKMILEEIGMKQNECLTVFHDNSSTISLPKNPSLRGRSKHIDIRFHFLNNLNKEGLLN